ncbi:MAG: hypothetical protein ABJA79_09550 [Parafilimonas sp.]
MPGREEEISFKQIFLKTRIWVQYFFSKWIFICAAGIAGGILGFIYASFSKPTYSASVSFILSNNSSSSGSFAGLASQFGIDLSNSGTDAFSGDNIINLMSSRSMVQKALLENPADKNEILLNLICRELKLNEGWQKQGRTKNAFPFPRQQSQMTPVQDSLFRNIYKSVIENFLTVSKPDKDQSIYNVTTTSTNEIFSYYLTKYLVDVTSAFYIDTKTSTAKKNLTMLQHESDSLRFLLGGAITNAASETDQTFNLNPAYQVKRSASQQSQARATVLGTAYGEIVKNLEIAKITLLRETPLYQIIDEPVLPLEMEKESRLKWMLIGGFLGGVLILTVLIGRKIILDVTRG